MSRILFLIVALAGQATAADVTPLSLAVDDSRVIIEGRGDIADIRYFALPSPPRLVIDLYATRAADARQRIALANGFTRLRMGAYPDKTRYVLDAGGAALPAYRVERADRRVVVTWQASAGPAASATAARPLPPSGSADPQLARVTAVELDTDPAPDGVSAAAAAARRHQVRIAVQPFAGLRDIDYFTLRAPGRLVVDLHGVRPGTYARRFALGGGFQRLRVASVRDKTRLVFDVDGDRWPSFEVGEDPRRTGVLVSWQAPAEAAPRPLAGPARIPGSPATGADAIVLSPAPPGPVADAGPADAVAAVTESAHSATVRTTLVADNAEIRDLLAQLAEVSGRPIVADESVSGRLTLRLVDVPWDGALDMVVAIAGLRVVDDGDVLRVTGPPAGGPSTPRALVGKALDAAR